MRAAAYSNAHQKSNPPLQQALRQYILENFLFTDDPAALADDDSFLAHGIIDSVGALEIALHLERTYGFVVREDEMLPENLDSVTQLAAFVERRLQEA